MIRRVSTTMVPVAVNLHLLRHGKYPWQKDAQGRPVELMHYRPGTKNKLSQYQGIWVLAPNGEILTTYGNRDPSFHWDARINDPLVRAFMARIDNALETFGEIQPRKVSPTEPHPFRGRGIRPDGSITLAAYINRSVLDSLTLSREQSAAFVPRDATVGTQWTVSEEVARTFSRLLSPISDLGHHPPRPQDVTDVRFVGKVTAIENGVAQLTYTGHIAATRRRGPEHASHGNTRLAGAGLYHIETRQLSALTLVMDGTYRGYPPWDTLRKTESLVEWTRSQPRDKRAN